jgi:hypothetical protein
MGPAGAAGYVMVASAAVLAVFLGASGGLPLRTPRRRQEGVPACGDPDRQGGVTRRDPDGLARSRRHEVPHRRRRPASRSTVSRRSTSFHSVLALIARPPVVSAPESAATTARHCSRQGTAREAGATARRAPTRRRPSRPAPWPRATPVRETSSCRSLPVSACLRALPCGRALGTTGRLVEQCAALLPRGGEQLDELDLGTSIAPRRSRGPADEEPAGMYLVRPAPGVERLAAAVMTSAAIPEAVEVGDQITDAGAEARPARMCLSSSCDE